MIFYDSHEWRTLVKLQGSIFPRAIRYAIPSTILAMALKYLVKFNLLELNTFAFLTDAGIYSGFTFVLGFCLVFRTSQSYERYWTAATSVHTMGAVWSDACGSLLSFTHGATASMQELDAFTKTVVRLFSLLHAVALEEMSDLDSDLFPLLDVEGLNKDSLRSLTTATAEGNRVPMVICWIKRYVMQSISSGILLTPAPILTRVFQEIGNGVVEFHKAQQVVIWPFPFPYTQLNWFLLHLYLLLTPLVTCSWDAEPWVCGMFTGFSVVCMLGVDLIASELENPFGDDANDLPLIEKQAEINRILVTYTNPSTWEVPQVLPEAKGFDQLIAKPWMSIATPWQSSAGDASSKQMALSRWLHLPLVEDAPVREALRPEEKLPGELRSRAIDDGVAPTAPPLTPGQTEGRTRPANMDIAPPGGDDLVNVLSELSRSLNSHLEAQAKQLDVIQSRHLLALETLMANSSRSRSPGAGNSRITKKSSERRSSRREDGRDVSCEWASSKERSAWSSDGCQRLWPPPSAYR